MPVRGLVSNRRHLFARQATFGTPIPAVRAYPYSGTPDADRQWTDPEGDFGSIDPVAAPYLGAGVFGFNGSLNPLNYNDLAAILSGGFGGAVTGSGSPDVTRIWTPASTSADEFDTYSYEFGDDVDGVDSDEPNDWMQFSDGVIDNFTIDSPEEGAGALTAQAQWDFNAWAYEGSTDNPPGNAIPSITDVPDTAGTPIYLKDCKVFINSDPSDIGSTQLTDSVHKFVLRVTQEKDKKRYANGTQSFAAQALGRGKRTIEVDLWYAKTPDTVGVGSESDAWSANAAVPRYLQVQFESLTEAAPGVAYSWLWSMPMRYYARAEGAIGNNAIVILTGHAFFEPDVLDYVFYSELVNTLPDADL